MSSRQHLRHLITERLAAAAEDIFSAFEQTIVDYEEEVNRQRKLLEIVCKPRVKLHRIELPQQHVFKEGEVLTEQQLWNQERNSSLDQEEPESLQMKEDQEEICTSHEGEQLQVKQEADIIMLTLGHVESNLMEPEPGSDHQFLSHSSAVAESQDQTGSHHVDFVFNRNAELERSDGNNMDNCHTSEIGFEPQTGQRSLECETGGNEYVHTRVFDLYQREQPHFCNICRKCFTTKAGLSAHVRTHTGEKPYTCETCGQCFRQSSTLMKHRRVHTNEKPYSCETCGQRFRERSNLKVHVRTHTGEKPYSCEMCGRRFLRRSNLNVHRRTHTELPQQHVFKEGERLALQGRRTFELNGTIELGSQCSFRNAFMLKGIHRMSFATSYRDH
uniref:zinc finger protein 771-like n=1 Tax=Solea senegalensis TaxID=28829 RepID=UPI001CD91492|nr:zinc finger protein 771-like [Solea senegalensis]